jgi:AmmeMemoRadiSam system protein B
METRDNVRPSPIAGQWYPDDPGGLASMVDQYIKAAQTTAIEGAIIAVIAPHAGLLFSGPVAAYAFALLQGLEPDIVAVISPMHHPYTHALLTSGHSAYQTPLGRIPVDRECVANLNSHLQDELGLDLHPIHNDPEHALEIELPFLQRVLSNEFDLLPVMVRDQSRSISRALGAALAKTLQGRKAIMVASTDLSHFYPQDMALKLDAEILKQLEAFDPEGVHQAEEEGKGFACGRGALAAVMWASKALGADTIKILHHATSGDVSGDYWRVVGYTAAVIVQKTPCATTT